MSKRMGGRCLTTQCLTGRGRILHVFSSRSPCQRDRKTTIRLPPPVTPFLHVTHSLLNYSGVKKTFPSLLHSLFFIYIYFFVLLCIFLLAQHVNLSSFLLSEFLPIFLYIFQYLHNTLILFFGNFINTLILSLSPLTKCHSLHSPTIL